MLRNLTQNNIDKIQIDEGIVVKNLGESDEKILGPTRGGAELKITPSIRDIEFDGRVGKTKGLQIKDGEDATLTVKVLCCSQENLAMALVNADTSSIDTSIKQGEFGLIKNDSYIKNISVVTKMADNTFKILKVFNCMHEGEFGFKCVSKSENEHNLEFIAHYDPLDITKKIYTIDEAKENPIKV